MATHGAQSTDLARRLGAWKLKDCSAPLLSRSALLCVSSLRLSGEYSSPPLLNAEFIVQKSYNVIVLTLPQKAQSSRRG